MPNSQYENPLHNDIDIVQQIKQETLFSSPYVHTPESSTRGIVIVEDT